MANRCRRRRAIAVLVPLVVLVAALLPVAPAGAAGGISVSQTTDLDPNGQWIQVSGSGYDTWEGRGVYVAFCLVPPAGQRPTPCGGGQSGGGSAWYAADQYGIDNGASQLGPGGSFSTSVYATPTIGSVDCRRVQCAVVTFTDHRNLTDRSQDAIVPVSFAAAPPPGDPGGGGGAPGGGGGGTGGGGGAPGGGGGATAEEPAPDLEAIAAAIAAEKLTALPAPALTVAADGLSVSDGTRTLRVDRNEKLSATGDTVKVAGHGFDPTKSIDVALCKVPTAGAMPSPCLGDGSGAGAAWVAAGPSPEGRAPTATFGADGTFVVELELRPVIADGVDCRLTACAMVTRNDVTRPNDRSQDLVIPLTFVKKATEVDAAEARGNEQAQAVVGEDTSGGGSAAPWIVAGIAAVIGVGVVVAVVLRRRRPAASGVQEG